MVEASGEFKPGLAVALTFKSKVKNDFHYTAFLSDDGRAEIGKEELLEEFDQSRNFFLMDFGDPRIVFTGQIEARIWGRKNVEKAMETYLKFKSQWKYKPDYFDNLQKALVSNEKSNCVITIRQVPQ